MTDLAPESLRRRNNQAVARRAAWRTRYRLLATSIRRGKSAVKRQPSSHQLKIELEGLQSLAQIMMRERELITLDLKDSAYEWV